MKVRDIQSVYFDELDIYHGIDKIFSGYYTNIPEELLDEEVIEIASSYNGAAEYSWIEVYV